MENAYVVDTLNRVVTHRNQEARRELRMRGTSVEERRGSVCKVTLAHQIVGLDGCVNVGAVNAYGNTHQHVLGSLSDVPIDAKKVRALQSLETKIVLWEKDFAISKSAGRQVTRSCSHSRK